VIRTLSPCSKGGRFAPTGDLYDSYKKGGSARRDRSASERVMRTEGVKRTAIGKESRDRFGAQALSFIGPPGDIRQDGYENRYENVCFGRGPLSGNGKDDIMGNVAPNTRTCRKLPA
jgi:hypothetical protein